MSRRDVVTIPTIWVALVISLLIHVAVLWKVKPRIHASSSSEMTEPGPARGPLVVQLAPRPRPPSARSREAETPPPAPPRAREARPRRAPERAPPPPIALAKPAPRVPSPPTQATPPVTTAPPAEDLASYVEARRRARGESAPFAPPSENPSRQTSEDANARANRLAAANLASDRKLSFGYDPRRGGGVFTIQRMTYDYAEFVFLGWNKDIRRNAAQLIEVRKGANSDIRIAVVRRMIAIIRDYEQEDFTWESKRLGRNVTLSARARDNSGLEDFLMREFFEESRRP